MKISKNTILITIIVLSLSFLVYFNFPENKIQTIEIKQEINYVYDQNQESTVYEYMLNLKENNKINFTEKIYPGIGKFIEEINGIKNGEKSWIYYVNGEKAQIGVSNYKLKMGDKLIWKYESFTN